MFKNRRGGKRNELISEYTEALSDIKTAKNHFSYAVQPEMVEASIYNYNAAVKRLDYAIRMLRDTEDEA